MKLATSMPFSSNPALHKFGGAASLPTIKQRWIKLVDVRYPLSNLVDVRSHVSNLRCFENNYTKRKGGF